MAKDSATTLASLWAKYKRLKNNGKTQKQVGKQLGALLFEKNKLCYTYKRQQCKSDKEFCGWVPAGWITRGHCRGKLLQKPINKVSREEIREFFTTLDLLEEQRKCNGDPMQQHLEWQLLYLRAVKDEVSEFSHNVQLIMGGSREIREKRTALEDPGLTTKKRNVIVATLQRAVQSVASALVWLWRQSIWKWFFFGVGVYWGWLNINSGLLAEIWREQNITWPTEIMKHEKFVPCSAAFGDVISGLWTGLRTAFWGHRRETTARPEPMRGTTMGPTASTTATAAFTAGVNAAVAGGDARSVAAAAGSAALKATTDTDSVAAAVGAAAAEDDAMKSNDVDSWTYHTLWLLQHFVKI